MKGALRNAIIMGVLASLFPFLSTSTGLADQEVTLAVNAHAKPVASDSRGIAFAKTAMKELPITDVRPLEEGRYEIVFSYPESEFRGPVFLSARVALEDGTKMFLPVRSSSTVEPSGPLPRCTNAPLDSLALMSHQGTLESLVEVRAQRRDIARKRINQLLDPTTLQRLREVEDGFGLSPGVPLDPSLSPYELVDRLYRIKNALQSVQRSEPDR